MGTLAVFYIGLHAYFDNKIIMREMKNTNEAQDLKFLTEKHQKKSFDNMRRNSLVRVFWRNSEKGFECVLYNFLLEIFQNVRISKLTLKR